MLRLLSTAACVASPLLVTAASVVLASGIVLGSGIAWALRQPTPPSTEGTRSVRRAPQGKASQPSG